MDPIKFFTRLTGIVLLVAGTLGAFQSAISAHHTGIGTVGWALVAASGVPFLMWKRRRHG